MTKRTFVLPVYAIRCAYNIFLSRSCLFLFVLKSLNLSIKLLNYFDTVTLYTKWRWTLPNISHLKKTLFSFGFFPQCIFMSIVQIVQCSPPNSANFKGSHDLRCDMKTKKRYENVCEIYSTYIKWPQNDLKPQQKKWHQNFSISLDLVD